MSDERTIEVCRIGTIRHGDEVDGVAEIIAGRYRGFFEISGLERSSGGVLVVILIGNRRIWRRQRIDRTRAESVKAEILGTKAFASLSIWSEINEGLPPTRNQESRRIVGIESQAGVVKIVTCVNDRTPIYDPAMLR